MRRFVLSVFGISVVFSSLCTMAYAKADAGAMAHEEACAAAALSGPSSVTPGICAQESTPCVDGSCFIPSAAEDGALSSNLLSLFAASSLPAHIGASLLVDFNIQMAVASEVPHAPPDIFFSVVRRE